MRVGHARRQIGEALAGHEGSVWKIGFRPDGTTLASGGADGTIILWDANASSWGEKSCQRAGRNFTHGEWAQYFPNEQYRETCEQWPLEPEASPAPSPTS